MSYGYIYNKQERENLTKVNYQGASTSLDIFKQNSGNILILLALAEKVDKIDFTDDERKSYEKMVKIWYSSESLRNREMKDNLAEILREQAIIAGVSNWEGYFSHVSEVILIDRVLENVYKNKEKLKKLLKTFNLERDFANEMLLNGYQFKNLRFADYIKNNEKIKYQNVDHLKAMLSILYEINIVTIKEKDWTKIVEFIDNRHDIVHNKYHIKKYRREKKYSTNEIEEIINIMSDLISKIDKIFFTVYKK